MSLLAIKRRRLYGKQPPSQFDDVGPCEDDRLAVVTLPEEEEPAPPRFDFLSQKTINTLVRTVLEKKTEQELHSLTVSTIMKDVLSVSTGQLTEEELNDKKDDFVSAGMKLIPKELATRLVSAVKNNRAKGEADAHGKLVRIDSQTMQKSYFVTISGLPSSSAPSREELQEILLTAFQEAQYSTDIQVTHLAIFREPHVSGGLHFHCATSLSQRCRWVPWKKSLEKRNIAAHFSQIQLAETTKHRKQQYSYMLRYCFLPSAHKALGSLDPESLLYHRDGRHPPLIDAIQGILDSEGVTTSLQEKFLQRVQAGKRGSTRFLETCLQNLKQGILTSHTLFFLSKGPACLCARDVW